MNRRAFFLLLLTSILAACAERDDAEQALLTSAVDVEAEAERLLRESMRLNSAVSTAFSQAKADLETDQFALFAQIDGALQEGTLPNNRVFDHAAEECLELAQRTEEVALAARVYAYITRFTELFSLPRESIPAQRLGTFLTDASKLSSELAVFLTFDRPERNKAVYYFAPAYNVVQSIHICAYAAAGYRRSTVESVLLDTIDTNQYLVGGGEAGDVGYLSDWVAAQTAGSASTQTKLDKDPIIYSLRRSLEALQRALE
jgi:hypothetical protein